MPRLRVRLKFRRWRDVTFFIGWAMVTVGVVGTSWRGWAISIGAYIGLGTLFSGLARGEDREKKGGEVE
jgi:hypothetical protein